MSLKDKINALVSSAKNHSALYPSNFRDMSGGIPARGDVEISGRGEVVVARILRNSEKAKIIVDGKTYYEGDEYSNFMGELSNNFGVYKYGGSTGWRSFYTDNFSYSNSKLECFAHPIVFNKSFKLINGSSETDRYKIIYCSY